MPTAPNKGKVHTRGELAVYLAVFAISAAFLAKLAFSIADMETHGNSWGDLNRQSVLVSNTIQQLVSRSSSIDMASGVTTSTLRLRMASSTMDPTTVYASGTAIYLAAGGPNSPNAPIALTDSNVIVNRFAVTKYQYSNGSPLVQLDLAMSRNSPSLSLQRSCSVQSSVSQLGVAKTASTTPISLLSSFKIGGIEPPWYANFFFSVEGWQTNNR